MRGPNNDDMFEVGASIALAVVTFLIFAIILLTTGCASCPECVPKIETVTVKVPIRDCPPPPEVAPLQLPEYPNAPESVDPEALKDWYAEMKVTVDVREQVLRARIELLLRLLQSYGE